MGSPGNIAMLGLYQKINQGMIGAYVWDWVKSGLNKKEAGNLTITITMSVTSCPTDRTLDLLQRSGFTLDRRDSKIRSSFPKKTHLLNISTSSVCFGTRIRNSEIITQYFMI